MNTSGDDFIKSRILTARGVQVMLSTDLSSLYDVEAKYLHRQVKRNANRFPSDFVFRLSPDEANALRCQNVTSKRGGDRYGVLAFTEQGVAMLSSVLKSDRAAAVIAKFNKQNPALTVKAAAAFHDRFTILDGAELYNIGASLKDPGRKYCAVSKMDAMFIPSILQRI